MNEFAADQIHGTMTLWNSEELGGTQILSHISRYSKISLEFCGMLWNS